MVIVSCPTKFHSFSLAEQLDQHGLLNTLYTIYHTKKNPFIGKFNQRLDQEKISLKKIYTFPYLAPIYKFSNDHYRINELFDKLVSKKLIKTEYEIFIGWSGMSLYSIMEAKSMNKISILERGSSHILHQNEILKEEYRNFGIDFTIDKRTIEKELKEYDLADYISIPSKFAYNSFIKYGIQKSKLLINNYGVDTSLFKPEKPQKIKKRPFRILYIGNLSIQKGLIYLFKALNKLSFSDFEAWFIGKIDPELNQTIKNYTNKNFHFFGHVNQTKLSELINNTDVAVHPSLQDGFGMVIPQILSCGVPVIATKNTGGSELIEDGKTGYIIPIKNSEIIKEKIEYLYHDREMLKKMRNNVLNIDFSGLSWNAYGERYKQNIHKIIDRNL